MTWVGLVYIPLAFVTALFQAGVQELPFVDALLALVDDHSALAFLFAVFVGSLGNLLAYVYVSAVVALTIERGGWRNEPVFARKLDSDPRAPAAGGAEGRADRRHADDLGRRDPVGDPPADPLPARPPGR